MKIIDTKFKVKKVIVDGQKKFVPIQKTTFLGFGWWVVPKDWEEISKRIESERALNRSLNMDSDSTLTHIRAFIDKNDPNPENPYYNQ